MNSHPVYNQDYQALIDGLKNFSTRSALSHSSFYQEHRARLDGIIDHIWQQPYPTAQPRTGAFLRVVQWNIERGRHLDTIVELFNTHPLLKAADVIALNEVDLGMIRTANRNIAFELGTRLQMHACFVAEFLELTKGIRAEAVLPGENREALHGNAILSRYPINRVRAVRLPSCFDTFEFSEKRYGERVALIAEIDCGAPLQIISTHLEVRHTPACRARQFRALLAGVDESIAAIITGDLNTGTFKRGHLVHTIAALVRLLASEPAALRAELRRPARYEPLFADALRAGFQFSGCNDEQPTCITPLQHLDEAKYFPGAVQNWLNARLARYGGQLEFRLDFIMARAIAALGAGAVEAANISSCAPQTVPNLMAQGDAISDHDPILCDFALPEKNIFLNR